MQAVICTQYGSPDVLKIQEVPTPTPKDDEVLVKIHTASVNFGDLLVRKFNTITPRTFSMPALLWLPSRIAIGIRKPKQPVLGNEFAGTIAAVGKNVTRLQPGDAVFGYRAMNFGTHAEYVCMPEKGLIAPKPANMSDEEACTVPYGAMTALNLLRKADVQPGQKVLINGASGSIGSYALQLARHFGAEVTGVCGTPRMEMVKSLGADHVIDYTREDFTKNGQTYDLIVDVLNKSSFAQCKNSLKPGGRYLLVSFKFKQVFQMLWTSRMGDKKVICALSGETLDDLLFIKELVEAGKLKAIIDRSYPLEQTAEAHRYIESGSKAANVVIRVAHGA